MNIIYYMFIAISVGWIITDLMDNRPGLAFNVLLSIVGAFLAGYFLTPYFHVRTIQGTFNLPTLGVTLIGTVVLVVIFNISRRSRRNW
jgi:uncharacterized membrane protein YeaQ/YmgE (transglycosylase-associated protein family)